MTTNNALAETLALIETEYGVEFSDDRRRVWALAFRDIPDDVIRRETITLLRESSFAQKLADLYRRCCPSGKDLDSLLDDESQFAIAHLEQHISDIAAEYGPVLNAVVRALGGLQQIVDALLSDQWKFRRKDALALYKALRRRGVAADSEEGRPVYTSRWTEAMNGFPPERYLELGRTPPTPTDAQFLHPEAGPMLLGPHPESSNHGDDATAGAD